MARRLAAILTADVVGYSRLMQADEEATLATLNSYRLVIDSLVAEHHGRVFGSAGDNVIVEFASPVEAVRCAIDIQREIEERNAGLCQERQMHFRIGVNLGDVMVEGANLFGDGVNVATRLEQLAQPCSVCISDATYFQVKGKVNAEFEDIGKRQV
jgi:class 3 adenylate cyclase